MEPAEAVVRFLEGLGQSRETDFYLRLFRAEAKERFATIAVDSWVARHSLDAVALDLHHLAALSLTPVVVLGLVEPALADEHAARLRRRLSRDNVPAEVLASAEHGEALAARVAEAARGGRIPIVPFDAADGVTVDARVERLARLLAGLATRKLIFLIRRGGLLQRGAPVGVLNLTTSPSALLASPEVSRKQRMLVEQSRRLVLDLVPHRLLVSLTSPIDLLREIFTVQGAGTLLRRGAHIDRRSAWSEVDLVRLRALVTAAFGRPPLEAMFARPVSRLFVEEEYRGAAVLLDTPLGAYLTKFVVDPEAQGEGLGRDLWDTFVAEHPAVFWRARPWNPIAPWYAREAAGLCRFPEWHVFWKGLANERIPAAIEYALAAPIDIPHEAT